VDAHAPGPTSGADQSNVIFMIYALLYATLTTFARSVIILVDTRACRTMPDYARMLSFLGQRPGEILDTGLLYEDLKRQRMLDKVPFLAKNLRMELGAPAGQLIQCKNQLAPPRASRTGIRPSRTK